MLQALWAASVLLQGLRASRFLIYSCLGWVEKTSGRSGLTCRIRLSQDDCNYEEPCLKKYSCVGVFLEFLRLWWGLYNSWTLEIVKIDL